MLNTITSVADDSAGKEQFIINDIEMGVSPSDIQVFDDNFVFEQSFLRSNSVFCYRSKYSDTKVVLSFPFQIGPLEAGQENSNHTSNCIRLITELNSYPYCFVKSPRIRTYVAPRVVSSTGFLMFAVEELALVQSAAASNLMFLEVVLRYSNHAPVAADFKFVSNQVANKSGTMAVTKDSYVSFEREMLQFMQPEIVSSLASSDVWADYVRPKVDRVLTKLAQTKLLRSKDEYDEGTAHPGLDVRLALPLVLTNAARALNLEQEDDGSFVGPDSKVVTVTDIDPIDDLSLPENIYAQFDQNFSEEIYDETGDERRQRRSQALYGRDATESNMSTAEQKSKQTDKEDKKGSVKSGPKEVFIQYSSSSLAQLGMSIQKVEVRRSNVLASQRIGSYKHPLVQYMGKRPARTTVHFTNNSTEVYDEESALGVSAFFTNAVQILDENRLFHPEAEAYNHMKIHSLATILLGAESGVPNQSVVSASAENAGVEGLVYTFAETSIDKFLEDMSVEASGARSISKAQDEVNDIVIDWLKSFTASLKNAGRKFSGLSSDTTQSESSLQIFDAICKATAAAGAEFGYSTDNGNPDGLALNYMLSLLSQGSLSVEEEGDTLELMKFRSTSVGSGLNLYLPSNAEDLLLSETEKTNLTPVTEDEGYATKLLRFFMKGLAGNYITESAGDSVKKQEKMDKLTKDATATTKADLSVSNYFTWFATYALELLVARKTAASGTAPTNIVDNDLQKSVYFDTMMMNVAALINANAKEEPISKTLSTSQKYFLENLADLYLGSLFGQNLEDIQLEDIISDYKRDTDVVIQNTDPFFFLHTEHILGTEMIEFYNNSYGLEKINPDINATEDLENIKKVTQVDNAMGLDLTSRKLVEVDFDAETFGYFADTPENSNIQSSDIAGLIQSQGDAREAIENALAKYGLSNNEAFRRYMYKTAFIESRFGQTLVNSKSGASGLFQMLFWAPAQVMMGTNKVFASRGLQNLSQADARATAKKLIATPGFSRDHQLNADIFIEYMLKNGGIVTNPKTKQFDEAYQFAYHNNGPSGGNAIGRYLLTGTNYNKKSVNDLFRANGADSAAAWYSKYTAQFASINVGELMPGSGTGVSGTAVLQSTATPSNKKSLIKKETIEQSSGLNERQTILGQAKQNAVARQSTSVTETQKPKSSSVQSNPIPFEKNGQILTATVKRIVDGDTIDVMFNTGKDTTQVHRIRLAGLDTKETTNVNGENKKYTEAMKPWGEEAKKELAKIIGVGTPVKIQYHDIDQTKLHDSKDKAARIVARVTTKDGTDPSKMILAKGLSDLNESYNTDRVYTEAIKKAQKDKLGIWSKLSPAEVKAVKEANKKVIQASAKYTEQDAKSGATDKLLKYNTWQPFQGGARYTIDGDFTYGAARGTVKGLKRDPKSPHQGIDLPCTVGTTIISAAAGIAAVKTNPGGYGLYIEINHENGFTTRYAHLSKTLIKSGQKVSAHEPIALSGGAAGNPNSGRTTGAHLHYEVRYKNTAIHPYSTKYTLDKYTSGTMFEGEGSMSVGSGTGAGGPYMSLSYETRKHITEENTVFNENELATAILTNARNQVNVGMKAAIPAIKAYVVIGNENDGLGLDTLITGSQYYELKGIQSFRMLCNNNESPIDTAIMTVVDPSYGNTDSWTSLARIPEISFDKIGSDFETQYKFNRLLLRPGTKLQVRLGYGNDPNQLTTVFNGGIMEVGNEGSSQMLTLLLEGYGRELVQEIKSPGMPEKLDGDHNSPTSIVIGKSLISKPIDHFGYMNNFLKILYKDPNDPEARAMVKGFWNSGSFSYFNITSAALRSRLYMNIFAPEIEKVDDEFAKYWSNFFEAIGLSNHQFGYPFFVHRMTPWDCCKQMEYRHPGTIFKPLIYEDRMTLFYGVKEQMYFAKDLSRYTQIVTANKLNKSITDNVTRNYFDRRRERMEPVCNIHIVSSSTNLISNQLRLNAKWNTVTNVSYFTDNDEFSKSWEWKSTKMEVDDNILPWEVREKELTMSGVHGKYTSFLYGTTDLKKEAETMYTGKIILTGNAKIKTGDFLFLDDIENRLSGLVLVRDCIQHFDPNNGFVTEVTPGLYTEPAQFMYTSLWLQLMAALKVGAAKTRLITSSSYSSEYNMVKEYLKMLKQMELSHNKKGEYGGIDTASAIAYGSAASLMTWMSYSMAGILGVKAKMPGAHIAKSTYVTLQNLFNKAELEITKKRVASIKSKDWYKSGSKFANSKYNWTKSKLIGSAAYQKVTKMKPLRIITWARNSALIGIPLSIGRSVTGVVMKGVIRAAFSLIAGIALTNPLGLLLDVALMLVFTWAYAKMEEKGVTRQPLLFFPLIKHGKPYQAGMTGAIRNTYIDSLTKEFDKTLKQISKAAAVLEGSNAANNKETSAFVSLLAKPARRRQEEKAEQYVMTKASTDNNYVKTAAQKQTDKEATKEAEKQKLAEATK